MFKLGTRYLIEPNQLLKPSIRFQHAITQHIADLLLTLQELPCLDTMHAPTAV
jgi:hypothetical protein